jgi:alpha-1,3-rhamnosyl/mannosyltransferase
VIPHGVSDEFRPDACQHVVSNGSRLRVPAGYVLYVGTIEPRKNLELLLECYGRLVVAGAVDEDLVLAGRLGWDYERVVALASAPSLRDRVHLLGYVDQGALAGLYAGARVFVYPSLEEGFGLPPLEAMACGVPVVASTAPALVENLDGAAELVHVDSPDALGDALLRMLRDKQLWETRRREGLARAERFRWEESARATLACYEELGGTGGAAADAA